MISMFKWWFTQLLFAALEDEGGGAADRGDKVDADTAAPAKEPSAEDLAAAKGEPKADDKTDDKADGEPPAAKKKDEPLIPKTRFDQVLTRSKEKDATIAALQAELRSKETNVDAAKIDEAIDALETKLEAARVDGNKDLVKQLAKQIRDYEKQATLLEAGKLTESARAAATQEIRFDLAVEALENAHAFLRVGDPSYDEAVVTEILELQAAYATTMTPADALNKAAKIILKTVKQPEPPAAGKPDAAKVEADRKAAAVRKAATAANGQPAALGLAGADSDKSGATDLPNIADMSAEEFSALPEATQRRLRGDTV